MKGSSDTLTMRSTSIFVLHFPSIAAQECNFQFAKILESIQTCKSAHCVPRFMLKVHLKSLCRSSFSKLEILELLLVLVVPWVLR